MGRILKWAIAVFVVLLILMQLVPIDRTNPPVTREVNWDSPETRALAQRACFDCHSNETVYPWYDRIAPASWLVANHVGEGRERLNFSEWDRPNSEADEIVESVREGSMPTWDYMLLHGAARLSPAEQEALATGLAATLTQDPPIPGREGRGGGDE